MDSLALGVQHHAARPARSRASALTPMQTLQFQLRGDYIELDKLLKTEGVCGSGGEAKLLVASGAVRVNGAVELRKSCKIRAGQFVETAGVRIDVLGDPNSAAKP
jgi:ribosome-associated protein